MRVNQNNPVSLFATPSASKAKLASTAREPGARPEIATTTTNLLSATKPLKIDLTASTPDTPCVAGPNDPATVNGARPFPIPEGAKLLDLIEAWGKGPGKYDFTQDGQVDMQDMMVMIHNWQDSFGELPTGQPIDPVDVDEAAPAPTAPVSNIETSTPETPSSPIEPSDSAPANPASPTIPSTNSAPTMLGLIGAWGENNSTYDFNFDGTVNMGDLLMMLDNGPGPKGPTPEFVQDTFENAEPPRRNVHSASANGKLKQLAEQISTRLSAEGFGDQPPINLRELVAQLNLSPKQTDFLMKQMQAKYPKGLGVSVIA